MPQGHEEYIIELDVYDIQYKLRATTKVWVPIDFIVEYTRKDKGPDKTYKLKTLYVDGASNKAGSRASLVL